MTLLIFSQLPESVFCPNFPGKYFPKNQTKFFIDWKVFFVFCSSTFLITNKYKKI
jgi:hypothetical protein